MRKTMAIRNVVGNGLGMPPESVAVTDLTTGAFFPPSRPGETGFGNQSPELQTQAAREKSLTEKVLPTFELHSRCRCRDLCQTRIRNA